MTSPEDNKIVETKEIVQPEVSQELTEDQRKEINWNKFQDAKKAQKKLMEENIRKTEEAQKQAQAFKDALDAVLSKTPSQSYEQQQQVELTDEERLQKLIDKRLEEQRRKDNEERALREQQELPQRLNQMYKDFDKVCTTENLDYLEFHYPEVAKAFQHMPDNIDKWANVYNAVKRFIPNTQPQADQKKIEKNLAKPQAMSVPGGPQSGDTAPYILDEAKKKANQARMQRVMKGL